MEKWKKLSLFPLQNGFPCPQLFIDGTGKESLILFGSCDETEDTASCYIYDIANDKYKPLIQNYKEIEIIIHLSLIIKQIQYISLMDILWIIKMIHQEY